MYQVEKLEEEQAKQTQHCDQQDEDEVWKVERVYDDLCLEIINSNGLMSTVKCVGGSCNV